MVPRSCCNAVSFLPITKTSDEEHNDNLNFRPKPTKNCFSIILFYERYYISVDDRKNIIIYIYIYILLYL